MHADHLQNISVKVYVHRNRFQLMILKHFAEAQEQEEGKNVVIVFKEGMCKLLREALHQRDFSEDASIFVKAAKKL